MEPNRRPFEIDRDSHVPLKHRFSFRRAWLLLVYWIKGKVFGQAKAGLPKDARPYGPSGTDFEVNYDYKHYMRFLEKTHGVKFPEFKNEAEWKDYYRSKECHDLLTDSETLTHEEVERHQVRDEDWEYLVEGLDEVNLKAIEPLMTKHLQNDGDVCMLPPFLDPDQHMGLRNEKGKIVPFIAKF